MPHLVAECYNYFHHSAVQVLSIFSCKMSLLSVQRCLHNFGLKAYSYHSDCIDIVLLPGPLCQSITQRLD